MPSLNFSVNLNPRPSSLFSPFSVNTTINLSARSAFTPAVSVGKSFAIVAYPFPLNSISLYLNVSESIWKFTPSESAYITFAALTLIAPLFIVYSPAVILIPVLAVTSLLPSTSAPLVNVIFPIVSNVAVPAPLYEIDSKVNAFS